MRIHGALASLLACTALSCTQPKAASVPPTAVDSSDTADAGLAASEDPREELMRATLARARVIQDEVAALRELRFSHPVPAKRQTVPDFRKAMIAELEKSFPANKSRPTSKALFHLGFLKTKMDLATALIEIAVGQVAAYYNPETGTFYAVTLSSDQAWLEIMTAHELTHGLQDQNFDLRHYIGEPSPNHPEKVSLTEDQINARRFVVEGEASMLMIMHAASKKKGTSAELARRTRNGIALMSGLSWQDMVASADADAASSGDNKAAKLSAMPPFLVAPTLEAYTVGARAVFMVHQAGGWEAVGELYSTPPESTEQLLHPKEKLIDTREIPTQVTLPDLSKRLGTELLNETLGELTWRVYLETWEIPAARNAGAGWGGDRVVVYQGAKGPIGLIATSWDSEEDAVEFENAFRRSLRIRTNQGTAQATNTIARYKKADGSEVLVRRDGNKIFIVDGAAGARADTLLSTIERDAVFR